MSLQSTYQVYSLTIPANGEIKLDVTGRFVAALAGDAAFKLGFEDHEPFYMTRGLTVGVGAGERFTSISLVETSGSPNTVQLAIGNGEFKDARLSLSGAVEVSGITAPVDRLRTATATMTSPTLTGSWSEIVAARAGRLAITLQANAANTNAISIALGSTAGGGRLHLYPGQAFRTEAFTGAILSNGNGQTLYVCEEYIP